MTKFQRGDHLVTPRVGYTHHGLYIGDDMVIHYSGLASKDSSGVVEIVNLDKFANGSSISTAAMIRVYDREEAVQRAYSRLGEDKYNLLWNNCESFVYWCITGVPVSPQVARAAHAGYQVYTYTKAARTTVTAVQALSLASKARTAVTTAKVVSLATGSAATSILATSASAPFALGLASVAAAPIALGVAGVLGAVSVASWLLDS